MHIETFKGSLLALTLGIANADVMEFQDFELAALPKNKAGDLYPNQYTGEGGRATLNMAAGNGLLGKSLNVDMSAGSLYLQFNAHNASGSRGFAREYAAEPGAWKFNHYNRLSFWMVNPENGAPLNTSGNARMQIGTYVKRVANPDQYSDETGGNHYYHHANVPNTGTWTRVVINTHPNHRRGDNGNTEPGNQLHPTKESGYNYFDALTRFYINETGTTRGAAVKYQFDDFEFYRTPKDENDDQIYTIAATFVPGEGRYILTWNRNKNENSVKHEVRYAERSVHEIGWAAATPAPNGVVTPAGTGGYNGMVYNTTAIRVPGGIYFAIKPQNSQVFSEIHLPSVTAQGPTLARQPAGSRGVAPAGAALRVADLQGRTLRLLPSGSAGLPAADAGRAPGAGRLRLAGDRAWVVLPPAAAPR